MRFNFKRIGLAAGAVAFSLTMVACHGQTPGSSSYLPTSSVAPTSELSGAAAPDHVKKKIVSSCGDHVHIVLAGIVDCKFRERSYGDGTFTLTNNTKGIVILTPMSGTKSTTFTILGALLGSGYFTVKDAKGRELRVTVKVTL
jgi:hypothetical protein